jgi:hypothetical protein
MGLDAKKKRRAKPAVGNVVLVGMFALGLVAFAVMLLGGYTAYAAKRVVVPGA